MKSAAALSLFAAAVAVSGCQNKNAGMVVPVVMAPYAVPPVTVGPTGQATNNGRAASGATQATPVAATSMNPAYTQPRPTTTPITAYNLSNMPIAATPVVTMPTMMAPAPAPVAVAAPAPAPQTAQQATPVMMMMMPGQAAPAGGQVMMMMVPAQAATQAQPVVAAPAPAPAPAPVMAQPVQLMNMPTYGAPVYVMPSAR